MAVPVEPALLDWPVDEAGAAWAACIAVPRTSPSLPDAGVHRQLDAACVADCVVDALLLAFAVDEAVFDCDTAPSLPGLSTRTEMFSFDHDINEAWGDYGGFQVPVKMSSL